MASDKYAFGEFLAVLEERRAALDALIASYRAALSIGALGQPGDLDVSQSATTMGLRSGGPIDLPQGALLGKSLPAAVQLYLSAARRKQTIREIMNALKEGGVESTSRNFENTVATALHRLKIAGTVLKFNDGWALAEFYPENLRNRIAAQNEAKTKTGKTKATGRVAKKKPPQQAKAKTVATSGGPSIDQRVLARLETRGPAATGDVATELGVDPKQAQMAFTRLIGRRKIHRDADGRYSVSQVQTEPHLRAV